MTEQTEHTTALVEAPRGGLATIRQTALSIDELIERSRLVDEVKRRVMREGEHYGIIPGTSRKDADGRETTKPTLLKSGAEKLCLVFRLVPRFELEERHLEGGHREIVMRCYLHHQDTTGRIVGEGAGSCSTLESKYRWRQSGRACPKCGAEAIIKGKVEYGGGWLCFAKRGGCGSKYEDGDAAIEGQKPGRVENPDIADTYNTALKIAKKRAYVDATITATAASDAFTQDLEDTAPEEPPHHATRPASDGKPASNGHGKPATSVPKGEGPQEVSGTVANVVSRPGAGKARGKTIYDLSITDADGKTITVSSFDANDAKACEQAREVGTIVTMQYAAKEYAGAIYRNVLPGTLDVEL